jgi:RNA ligase
MELIMNYEFPTITNISDVLPAIAGRDEFVVAVKEGYTVINYNVMMADTFPDVLDSSDLRANHDHYEVENLHARLRRECRGIIFDTATGDIIRRPFHKFFNVNERDETQDHRIDLSRSHAILEKLDGSMIAPFIVNDEMIWGTKMGATDVARPVEAFVEAHPEYRIFAKFMISRGYTPIFEWCSRKQRIVLDYQEDQLILTAIRSLYDGRYVSRDLMQARAEDYRIPVVRAFNMHEDMDMKAFVEYVRDLEDLEGFIVRFNDGHMLKLKCHWYLQIHKAKEAILQDRNIVELILEEHLDDVKAHLPAEDRDRLTQFENDINKAINISVSDIRIELDSLLRNGVDRKTFATGRAQELDGYYRPIIFRLFGREDVSRQEIDELVRNTIRNNLGRTAKYEALRDVWFPGVRFNDA